MSSSNIGSENARIKADITRRLGEAFARVQDVLAAYEVKLADATATLESAVDAFNSKIEEAFSELTESDAVTTYMSIKDEAVALAENVSTELSEEFSERSEKWQESDAGQEFSEWVSEWEGFDFEDPLEFVGAEAFSMDMPDTSDASYNTPDSCPVVEALESMRDAVGG